MTPPESVMKAVFKRPWYFASIALALAAIAVDFGSKRVVSSGVSTRANAVAARHDGAAPHVLESMHAQADAAAHWGIALGLIGLVIAVAAGACLFVSIQNRETFWDVIPIGLLLCYVASSLVVV
jgi:hypothetical protein